MSKWHVYLADANIGKHISICWRGKHGLLPLFFFDGLSMKGKGYRFWFVKQVIRSIFGKEMTT